jgi:hypothetical protein
MGAHPRLLLTPAILARLQERAQTGTDPGWQALQSSCEDDKDRPVEPPDAVGSGEPPGNDIGPGYYGEEYYPALLDLSLCYRIDLPLDAGEASRYAAKAVEILLQMASPCINVGSNYAYGIRFYGVGMALAYDWLHDYDGMTAGVRAQVAGALMRWILGYRATFEYNHPLSNYFAGYFATEVLSALALAGDDDTDAQALYDNWYSVDYAGTLPSGLPGVQPYFRDNLAGGGWPEGFEYGPLATMNLAMGIWAVDTATGVDLTRDAIVPFHFIEDSASFAMQFSWPDNRYIDDIGTWHSSDLANAGYTNMDMLTMLAGITRYLGKPIAPQMQDFVQQVRANFTAAATQDQAANQDPTKDSSQEQADQQWLEMLFWDPGASSSAPYTTLPLSSTAAGLGMASYRSSWQANATWGDFAAAPYVDSPARKSNSLTRAMSPLCRAATRCSSILAARWGGWRTTTRVCCTTMFITVRATCSLC